MAKIEGEGTLDILDVIFEYRHVFVRLMYV